MDELDWDQYVDIESEVKIDRRKSVLPTGANLYWKLHSENNVFSSPSIAKTWLLEKKYNKVHKSSCHTLIGDNVNVNVNVNVNMNLGVDMAHNDNRIVSKRLENRVFRGHEEWCVCRDCNFADRDIENDLDAEMKMKMRMKMDMDEYFEAFERTREKMVLWVLLVGLMSYGFITMFDFTG